MFVFVFLVHCVQSQSKSTEEIPGTSLRLCRELNYECILNEAARADFHIPPDARQNADQQLVNRFNEMAKRSDVNQTCLFHWKNLMCSYVFVVARDKPPCAALCTDVRNACGFDITTVQCAPSNSSRCTDYSTLTGLCAKSRPLRRSGNTGGGRDANNAIVQPPVNYNYVGDAASLEVEWLLILIAYACVLWEVR